MLAFITFGPRLRAPTERSAQMVLEDNAHLEKVPSVRAEGHPPFKKALVEDDVFSLIHDLNLQSLRFLAFRIIVEVLPVDNNAMVAQTHVFVAVQLPLDAIKRRLQASWAGDERDSLLPIRITREAAHEQDVQLMGARRIFSDKLRA